MLPGTWPQLLERLIDAKKRYTFWKRLKVTRRLVVRKGWLSWRIQIGRALLRPPFAQTAPCFRLSLVRRSFIAVSRSELLPARVAIEGCATRGEPLSRGKGVRACNTFPFSPVCLQVRQKLTCRSEGSFTAAPPQRASRRASAEELASTQTGPR